MNIIQSESRGSADHGWLRARHTFSFADYFDPERVEFGTLRVINEDRVAPGKGFGTHPHRDMEIITYVIDGAIEHKDSMGNGTIITPGEVQRMTAGTGVLHSEFNHSQDEELHLLQIWIYPERNGLEPGYEQTRFPREEKLNRLRLVGSHDGKEGSVTIHQDVDRTQLLTHCGSFPQVLRRLHVPVERAERWELDRRRRGRVVHERPGVLRRGRVPGPRVILEHVGPADPRRSRRDELAVEVDVEVAGPAVDHDEVEVVVAIDVAEREPDGGHAVDR